MRKITVERLTFLLAIPVCVLIALALGGCGEKPKADCMGYTWMKTAPVAAAITIRQETDWRKYPQDKNDNGDVIGDGCRQFGIQGCTTHARMGTFYAAEILVKEPPDSYTGSCNTLAHEIRHAMGEVHQEAHSYTPQDHTR